MLPQLGQGLAGDRADCLHSPAEMPAVGTGREPGPGGWRAWTGDELAHGCPNRVRASSIPSQIIPPHFALHFVSHVGGGA